MWLKMGRSRIAHRRGVPRRRGRGRVRWISILKKPAKRGRSAGNCCWAFSWPGRGGGIGRDPGEGNTGGGPPGFSRGELTGRPKGQRAQKSTSAEPGASRGHFTPPGYCGHGTKTWPPHGGGALGKKPAEGGPGNDSDGPGPAGGGPGDLTDQREMGKENGNSGTDGPRFFSPSKGKKTGVIGGRLFHNIGGERDRSQ